MIREINNVLYEERSDKRMTPKALKIFGFVLSGLGMGISIAQSIIADKELDHKIAKKVSEALHNK